MPIEITMPALSPTMVEGNLTKWNKKEGDKVSPGDVIAEIETDKATMEVESVDEGILGKILVKAGTKNVKVNEIIALLLNEGENKKSLELHEKKLKEKLSEQKNNLTKNSTENKNINDKANCSSQSNQAYNNAPSWMTPPPIVPIVTNKPARKQSGDEELKASPLAKNLAKNSGLNISRITGTGPEGRVVKEDVERAIKSGITAGRGGAIERNQEEQTLIENSSVRQVIAMRLLQSKQHVPHFYLTIDCDIDKLLDLRKELNLLAPTYEGDVAYKISVNDLVIKAASLALRDVPEVNASWTQDAIVRYNNIDISIAVATDGGLITPIIKNADQKAVQLISIEMKNLAKKAKQGTLKPEEFQGGGFSISNLGMYGIKEFKAIINPPQSCILAVGSAEEKPVALNGQIGIATMMSISLSCDHRVVDGAVGAKFLASFKKYIENPLSLIL